MVAIALPPILALVPWIGQGWIAEPQPASRHVTMVAGVLLLTPVPALLSGQVMTVACLCACKDS